MSDRLLGPLHAIVGPSNVIDLAADQVPFVRDWTGRWEGTTPAVVRPASTSETAEVLRFFRHEAVPFVPQGGNTGLVGGSVPHDNEVVLSTRLLDDLGAIDELEGTVTVGAGVTLGALQRHLAGSGWRVPVDIGARDSATIGGMVATNAGGLHVVRHGSMRRHVLGVEAVLGNGQVVSHLAGLRKDNTGFDLAGLLTGSEGTLGVCTKVSLALIPEPEGYLAALCGADDWAAAVRLAAQLRASPPISAIEAYTRAGARLVREVFDVDSPLAGDPAIEVLIEAEGDPDDLVALVGRLVASVEGARADDMVMATDTARRARLWETRERHTEAVAALGAAVKLDITLPLRYLAEGASRIAAVVERAQPSSRCILFGHLGDGNLHVNVAPLPPSADAADLERRVLAVVAELGGSISAEHGIGVLKKPYLHLSRSEAEIDAFRAIKAALDPAQICNPNVLLPDLAAT